MYYVHCPICQTQVEIPNDSVGPDRTDLFNITYCYECDVGFDYDDEDVMTGEDPSPPVT